MPLIRVPQGNYANEVVAEAIVNGCDPKWHSFYQAYVCCCDDGLHLGDSQCSIITAKSAKRRRT